MTAHGSSQKSMVTVPLDAGMEAVVTLDHVTGALTGYVLDRVTAKFFVQYRYNVSKDFGLKRGVRPQFSIGAGRADFRRFSGNERLAEGMTSVSHSQF